MNTGRSSTLAGGAHGAIESFHVTDGEQQVVARGRGEQVVRLGEGHRQRLLHEHGHAAAQALETDLMMARRRHRDGHRLDVLQEFGATGECAAAEFRGGVGRTRQVDVEHPDQLDAVHRGQVARVMAPERTNADHADGKRLGHAGTPRCDDETNSRKRSTSAVDRKIGPGAFQRLAEVQVGIEAEAVGSLERCDRGRREVVPLQPDGVETVQLDRIADRLDERRNVLVHAGHAADECILADPARTGAPRRGRR